MNSKHTGILFIFLVLVPLVGIPNNSTNIRKSADSLLMCLQYGRKPEKIKIYQQLFDLYFDFNSDSAEHYAREGFKTSVKKKDKTAMADFLYNLAFNYERKGKLDSCVIICMNARQIYQKVKNRDKEARTAILQMKGLSGINQLPQALEIGLNFFSGIKEVNEEKTRIDLCIAIADCYAKIGEYETALKILGSTSSVFDPINPEFDIQVRREKASILAMKGDLSGAILIQTTILSIPQLILPNSYAHDLMIIGTYYSDLGKEDSARVFFIKSLSSYFKTGFIPGQAESCFQLGVSWLKGNHPSKALEYLLNSLTKYEQIEDLKGCMSALDFISQAYEKAGEFKIALRYLDRYMVLSDSLNEILFQEENKRGIFKEKLKKVEEETRHFEKETAYFRSTNKVTIYILSFLVWALTIVAVYQIMINDRNRGLFSRLKESVALAKNSDGGVTGLSFSLPPDQKERGISSNGKKLVIKEETLEIINANLNEWIKRKGFLNSVTIGDVAIELNTNIKYLSECININFGIRNFNLFINKLRLDFFLLEIEKKPEISDRSIDLIANELGFGSKTTFTKVFREFTGLTPRYYLQKLRKE